MGQVKIGQDGAALCKDGENFLLTPKRNLFQAHAQKPQLSSQTWRKVCNLGNPYELPTDEGASTSSAKGWDSAASLLYLSSRASAPFFAAAIADVNMTLSFPEEKEQDH